jgi:hypothetical protein
VGARQTEHVGPDVIALKRLRVGEVRQGMEDFERYVYADMRERVPVSLQVGAGENLGPEVLEELGVAVLGCLREVECGGKLRKVEAPAPLLLPGGDRGRRIGLPR